MDTLPPEVTTDIFCFLPSFSNVFAFSATCRQLRRVWNDNANSIYRHVARRDLSFERRRPSDIGGPSRDSPVSAVDVVRLVHDSHVVDKAAKQFEIQVVGHVRSDGFDKLKCYTLEDLDGKGHPSYLTHTERPRFIKAYYQLWTMMEEEPEDWCEHLRAMTMKQLYRLHEMTNLPQSVGRQEDLPTPTNPDEDPNSVYAVIGFRAPEKRVALQEEIWKRIEELSTRLHGREAYDPWCVHAKHEGFRRWLVIWDHWQETFMEICHGTPSRKEWNKRPDPEKRQLWEESSDEEK